MKKVFTATLLSLAFICCIWVIACSKRKPEAQELNKPAKVAEKEPIIVRFKARQTEDGTVAIIFDRYYNLQATPFKAGDRVLVFVFGDEEGLITNGKVSQVDETAVYEILYQIDLNGNPIGEINTKPIVIEIDTNSNY